MKVKASYCLAALVVVPIAMSTPKIQSRQASMAPVANFRKEQSLKRSEESARAAEQARGSAIAMQRVKSFCTIVIDKKTGLTLGLSEGYEAVSTETGAPLPDGFVCTDQGSTGEVQGGVIRNVRNVSAADKDEYLKYLDRQR